MNEFLAGILTAIMSLLPGGASEPVGYAGYPGARNADILERRQSQVVADGGHLVILCF